MKWFFDASLGCAITQYYMGFFVWGVPAEGGSGGGVADTRKKTRMKAAWWSFWLFHLLWHREWLLNAIWVSALYGATSMKYIFPHLFCPSFYVASSTQALSLSLFSNWRCSKVVWGQRLLKVRPRERLTLTPPPSDASPTGCACCSGYQISASFTKAPVLNPLSAPQITSLKAPSLLFPAVIYGHLLL